MSVANYILALMAIDVESLLMLLQHKPQRMKPSLCCSLGYLDLAWQPELSVQLTFDVICKCSGTYCIIDLSPEPRSAACLHVFIVDEGFALLVAALRDGRQLQVRQIKAAPISDSLGAVRYGVFRVKSRETVAISIEASSFDRARL
jgi:hypothetical protein